MDDQTADPGGSRRRGRYLGGRRMIRPVVLAVAGSTVLAGGPADVRVESVVQLAGSALIMGGTGMPTPSADIVDKIGTIFIDPFYPGQYDDPPIVLTTPEQFSGQSYEQGEQILLHALTVDYRDQDLLVVGVSQSAGIAGMALRDLDPTVVSPDNVQFALLAPPTAPNGIFEQPQLHDLMTLVFGADVTAPFPVDSPYDVDVYYGAYDPISDAPPNLWNPFTDWNAIMGLATVHGGYVNLTTDQMSEAFLVSQEGTTSFFMIPTEHLPILYGTWNTPIEDLLDPVMRVLVNTGYGDLNHGLVDAVTGAGLPLLDPASDPMALFDAAQAGWDAFVAALGF